MPSKTGVSPLGKRFFVESFDISSFIFLGSSHPFCLWSEPTVGRSGAVWAKEYALVEETNDNFIENYKCDIWSRVCHIFQGCRKRRVDPWWYLNTESALSPSDLVPSPFACLLLACPFLGHILNHMDCLKS